MSADERLRQMLVTIQRNKRRQERNAIYSCAKRVEINGHIALIIRAKQMARLRETRRWL